MTRLVVFTVCLLVTACTTPGLPAETSEDPASETTLNQTTEPIPETTEPIPETTWSDAGNVTCWTADPGSGGGTIQFTETARELGLLEPLKGIHGHAAIWTDANRDDREDLFVGTFADRDADRYRHRGANGPNPDRLLIQNGQFSVMTDFPEMYTRTSGGASADLDQDGDLDLVLSRNYRDRVAGKPSTEVLRNDGGSYTRLTDAGLPAEIGGRSVAIFDYDLDGRLDLFITVDRWSGGGSVLLENRGDLSFVDVTSEAGLPGDIHGLGVAASDFTNDGRLDLFVGGSNRLFIGDENGFTEAPSDVFQWEVYGNEDDVAGVSVADLNRDGWLDLAIGHHYNSTVDFGEKVPVRIYLNRGSGPDGLPIFDDVTHETGLPGLPTKAPHVELNDFDNDGWPDLLTSASASEGAEAAVFRHEGLEGDVPQFSSPSGLGSSQYWVSAPTADFNQDGRLDFFLLEWEPALPSLLMRNDTDAGNWLQVSIDAGHGFGLGWRVEVHDGSSLIGAREVTVTQGYSAGVSPVAHFGLGHLDEVRVTLKPPGTDESISLGTIDANQHVRYPGGCG